MLRQLLAGVVDGGVEWVARTTSTNDLLVEAVESGRLGPGSVIVADFQTAGRGRMERTWLAPPGSSVLMSVAVAPPWPLESHPLVSLGMAMAAADAVAGLCGLNVELKWPNDLLLSGRKLGGILAQSVSAPDGTPAVVVGVGLNVSWPRDIPADIADSAVALNHITDVTIDRVELCAGIVTRLWPMVGPEAPPAEAVVMAFARRCATLGQRVRVHLVGSPEAVCGRAVSIRSDGALAVETDRAGTVHVTTGDVEHLRPA